MIVFRPLFDHKSSTTKRRQAAAPAVVMRYSNSGLTAAVTAKCLMRSTDVL